MPFRSGKKPVLELPVRRLRQLILDLLKAGYEEHTGHKVRLSREVATLRKRFRTARGNRQCHVQVVCQDGHKMEIFAHTEPDMNEIVDFIVHGYSALLDHANYQAGARMLLRDLPSWRPSTNKRS